MALPLLKVLSNRQVLSSLVLENDVNNIFTFLFGRNGRRSISLFGFLVQHVSELQKHAEDDMTDALDAIITVFSKVLDLNGAAILMDEFSHFAVALTIALRTLSGNSARPSFARAEANLKRLQMRLGLGNALPVRTAQHHVVELRPTSKLKRDAPGEHSDQGPRHDNGFAQIKNIRIMPTALEIQSLRTEYLPGIDASQFHIPGVDGLLDRHFRLVREDNVGLLRDAIRAEIDTHRDYDAGTKRATPKHIARTFVYREARLYDMKFHKFRGLDLIYTFKQPSVVATMRSSERRKWWQASRRLQNGALVCVLDFRGNPLFCSVSSTRLTNEESDAKKVQPPEDTPAWANVYENDAVAFVVLSLVDTDVPNIMLALENFDRDDLGSSETLLEFPGVLLPSFQPTLKALQRMQGSAEFLFAEFLAPLAPNAQKLHSIPPPAYATKGTFSFDLSCLTGGKRLDISVSPDTALDASKKALKVHLTRHKLLRLSTL